MGTVGELERNAGTGSSTEARTAFWLQFNHLEARACLDAGVVEFNRLIAARSAMALSSGKTRREALPELDGEQLAALPAHPARHGQRWKSILNNVWRGGAPYDDGRIRRRLRNTHGPSWLQRYRLPKALPPVDDNDGRDVG